MRQNAVISCIFDTYVSGSLLDGLLLFFLTPFFENIIKNMYIFLLYLSHFTSYRILQRCIHTPIIATIAITIPAIGPGAASQPSPLESAQHIYY